MLVPLMLALQFVSVIAASQSSTRAAPATSGCFVITLNGEIYNYREVRRELEARQHTFRTQSDTEVLLSAWEEWGVDCLPRLNGMFAFAIWDNQEQTLTLVRDRVGIKPLYYSRVTDKDGNSWFAFASEIKAILAAGIIEAEINTEALNQYLTFLWTPDPHTLFKDIWKLP